MKTWLICPGTASDRAGCRTALDRDALVPLRLEEPERDLETLVDVDTACARRRRPRERAEILHDSGRSLRASTDRIEDLGDAVDEAAELGILVPAAARFQLCRASAAAARGCRR